MNAAGDAGVHDSTPTDLRLAARRMASLYVESAPSTNTSPARSSGASRVIMSSVAAPEGNISHTTQGDVSWRMACAGDAPAVQPSSWARAAVRAASWSNNTGRTPHTAPSQAPRQVAAHFSEAKDGERLHSGCLR